MAIRTKRSISLPPDLDAQIRVKAQREGQTYSAWLADAARRQLTAGGPSLIELIREAPSFDLLELERAPDAGREVSL